MAIEIGKTEKINISVVRPTSRYGSLRARILNLMPGEGFTLSGIERDQIANIVHQINNQIPKQRLVTHKVGVMKFQVIRVK